MIVGEDSGRDDDDDDEEDSSEENKPVRVLSNFVIFDPAHGNEFVSLDELLNGDNSRQFEAVGYVAPMYANEEDAAQDDDVVKDASKQVIRTTAIFDFMMDYTSDE